MHCGEPPAGIKACDGPWVLRCGECQGRGWNGKREIYMVFREVGLYTMMNLESFQIFLKHRYSMIWDTPSANLLDLQQTSGKVFLNML